MTPNQIKEVDKISGGCEAPLSHSVLDLIQGHIIKVTFHKRVDLVDIEGLLLLLPVDHAIETVCRCPVQGVLTITGTKINMRRANVDHDRRIKNLAAVIAISRCSVIAVSIKGPAIPWL